MLMPLRQSRDILEQKTMRTYKELIKIPTYEDRFKYLMIKGKVGDDTFGWKRYLNQVFYRSDEWKQLRDYVIIRDGAYDLGIEDDIHLINTGIEIHHMNPLTRDDVINRTRFLLDPDFLITTHSKTHKAIHYGDESYLLQFSCFKERSANDTTLWSIRKN